jgi:hypothetical protein
VHSIYPWEGPTTIDIPQPRVALGGNMEIKNVNIVIEVTTAGYPDGVVHLYGVPDPTLPKAAVHWSDFVTLTREDDPSIYGLSTI